VGAELGARDRPHPAEAAPDAQRAAPGLRALEELRVPDPQLHLLDAPIGVVLVGARMAPRVVLAAGVGEIQPEGQVVDLREALDGRHGHHVHVALFTWRSSMPRST